MAWGRRGFDSMNFDSIGAEPAAMPQAQSWIAKMLADAQVGDREPPPPGENAPINPAEAGLGEEGLGDGPQAHVLRQALHKARTSGLLESGGAAQHIRGPGGALQAAATSHGARKGQRPISYDLGDGRKANVYYDRKGKRSVQIFRV